MLSLLAIDAGLQVVECIEMDASTHGRTPYIAQNASIHHIH